MKLKLVLAALTLFLGAQASAIDVSAYYVGGCERLIGVPLQVDASAILLLTLDGDIKKVPRYEVTYVANYPIDVVPFKRVSDTSSAPPIRILTRQNGDMVELVTGWPVEFTEQKIAFLTTTGAGLVIDKSAIWKIETSDQTHFEFAAHGEQTNVEFVHPQVFEACPKTAKEAGAVKTVAQQLLSEPVAIKREFDRLQKGHELVAQYEDRQRFFPYPHVYGNDTLLGLWTSANSRYGASGYRSNNWTPLLQSDLNLGPFSYQHRFVTGSGPSLQSVHEEAQTQASYSFKADYFRLEVMTDLSQILIGSNRYTWNAGDLDNRDFRLNDVARIAFGIDYGAMSLILIPVHVVNVGAKSGQQFLSQQVGVPRFGVAYRKPAYEIDFTGGSGTEGSITLSILRLNAKAELNALTSFTGSWIHRTSSYSAVDVPLFTRFDTASDTAAFWLEHRYHQRFPLGVTVSVERLTIDDGSSGVQKSNYFKGGVFAGLIF